MALVARPDRIIALNLVVKRLDQLFTRLYSTLALLIWVKKRALIHDNIWLDLIIPVLVHLRCDVSQTLHVLLRVFLLRVFLLARPIRVAIDHGSLCFFVLESHFLLYLAMDASDLLTLSETILLTILKQDYLLIVVTWLETVEDLQLNVGFFTWLQ